MQQNPLMVPSVNPAWSCGVRLAGNITCPTGGCLMNDFLSQENHLQCSHMSFLCTEIQAGTPQGLVRAEKGYCQKRDPSR